MLARERHAGGSPAKQPQRTLRRFKVKKVALAVGLLFVGACTDVGTTSPDAANVPSLAVNTAPGQNKLTCFDGPSENTIYGGSCTITSKAAKKGAAVLDNTDGDTDGSYSGVYIETNNLAGQALSDITSISFQYTGTATAGSPRISLPLSSGGYAFISAYYCNNGAGLVDAINDETCTIYYGANSYENWDAFVAANPGATVGTDYSFIIADDPGTWTISNVRLGL